MIPGSENIVWNSLFIALFICPFTCFSWLLVLDIFSTFFPSEEEAMFQNHTKQTKLLFCTYIDLQYLENWLTSCIATIPYQAIFPWYLEMTKIFWPKYCPFKFNMPSEINDMWYSMILKSLLDMDVFFLYFPALFTALPFLFLYTFHKCHYYDSDLIIHV